MAEILVSKILKLLPDIKSQLEEEIKLVTGVENAVEDLSSRLTTIKTVLRDAERRKLRDAAVGIWLGQLEDAAYEMDDLLDEWNTKIHRRGVEAAENSAPTSTPWETVRGFVLSYCLCYKEVSWHRKIALQIVECNGKIRSILTEARDFHFVTSHSDPEPQELRRPETTSDVFEREVQGRKDDKDIIVSKLTLCEGTSDGEDGIPVVSILGVGGLGKTTLAQSVFHDDRVKKHFELKNWVCVSDPFDEKRIVKAILEGLNISTTDVSVLESLFQRLRYSVGGKKLLLVLDDVWTEDYQRWKKFVGPLGAGAPGSRILVTTRKERVVKMVGSSYLHRLSPLKNSDCWSIIRRIALAGRSEEDRFGEIGRKIAESCKGLPLAATFLGSLLRLKNTLQQWQLVLDSEIWEMEEAEVELFSHLYLSYNELSPEMKRCFSHCAVFPKDTRIDVERLIRIWMAQGFLGSSIGAKELERKGREYYDNLAMLSFFQDCQTDRWDENVITYCKMHDIVHDFAQFLTKGDCSTVEMLEGKMHNLSHDKIRHLTLLDREQDLSGLICDATKPQSFHGPIVPQILCSCLNLLDQEQELSGLVCSATKLRSFYGPIVPSKLFTCLKGLRVLDLSDCELGKLPREIGYLIHLRFLDFSYNPLLEELPEALCDLYNLETLDISWCGKLIQLPEQIGNLVNLRCLRNWGAVDIREIPERLGKLTSLRELTSFSVWSGYNNLGCLKYLNQLQRTLKIVINGEFDDEDDSLDFEKAELKNKSDLVGLELSFRKANIINNRGKYIETLEPPPNLRDLSFDGYPNTKLPTWIFTSLKYSLTNLVVDGKCTSLEGLSMLPSLETLAIMCNDVKHIGREFLGLTTTIATEDQTIVLDNEIIEDGTSSRRNSLRPPQPSAALEAAAFPKLKKLDLWFMYNLETWEDVREEEDNVLLPNLQVLTIVQCVKLKRLPHRILRKASSLNHLGLYECSSTLEQRYKKETGEDWIYISHIPNVQIWNDVGSDEEWDDVESDEEDE